MNRSRSQIDGYSFRYPNLHKPGVIPRSSRRVSPITSSNHKYELKQQTWPKKSVEAWFEHHSPEDRRAVFSFLNTIYHEGEQYDRKDRLLAGRRKERPEQVPTSRLSSRLGSGSVQNGSTQNLARIPPSNQSGRLSRASKKDLGEILESLDSLRPSLTQEKGIQTTATPIVTKLPDVNHSHTDQKREKPSKRANSSMEKYTEVVSPDDGTNPASTVNDEIDTKIGRRYLSHTWRVINPREDPEPTNRPENNSSSFFNYTKKVHPEYFFIHPDWY